MPFRKPHQTSDLSYIKDINVNGKKGKEIKPKGLNIIWGNDTRYWKLTPDNYAELIQVSWLEVSGKVDAEKGGKYMVKFEVAVNSNGFGWDNTHVLVMAKVGKNGKYEYKEVTLECGKEQTIPVDDNDNEKKVIVDVPTGEGVEAVIHFGLYEVWSGKWKGGLIIKKAEVLKIN